MGATAATAIDQSIVREQLKRILASPHFAETTRLNRFLRYLVEQSLAGNTKALKGYAIGLDVFDRADDFDPSVDTIVRVQAGKMRRRLDLYYAREGLDDPLRIHVPKGSYAPVFEVALDAGGPRADEPPEQSASSRAAIAVLPFENLSGDPRQEFLADGMTEEIITALARFRELLVMSRHSSFRYKNRPIDPRELADELGVGFLVEGSVRRWKDNVRVTAQLIDGKSAAHLFSEVYDRSMCAENLFDIQEDIAAHIAVEVAEPHGTIHRLGRRRRQAETQALDAYECRLLASEYWRSPTREAHARIHTLLERAVLIDPDYAGAWGMLAIVYGDEVRGGYHYGSDVPPLDRALEAAHKSTQIDPLNATGHHALFLTHFHRGEFDAYAAAEQTALHVNPNYPDMLADMGLCAAFRGDWDRGFELINRAIDLCPNPPGWYQAVLTHFHYHNKDYTAALAAAHGIGQSAWGLGPFFILMALGQLGRADEAADVLAELAQEPEEIAHVLRTAFEIWQVPRDYQDHMIEGWDKAGLQWLKDAAEVSTQRSR